jgi:riboflavin biosynthesis pyrimidine reductase
VDKLLVFVAPVLSGAGPPFLGELDEPVELSHLTATPSGEDVLLEAYVHVP